MHTLTARALKRTHWLYEPESFVPAAQLVETYDQHAQRMTGTHSVAYSSAVSTGTATFEPQLYYIHTDHLGTPQELTDREGQLHWVGQYRAWGELAKASDSEGNAASVEMPLRFQGQYFDAETGLHYNRFRYYDPQLGRFTTQDPISLAGGINLYQYAPNPVQWVDLVGLAANRGGIQAQGSKLEESVSWNQDEPLTVGDALKKLEELKNKLGKKDLAAREDAFKKAEKYVKNAGNCGGADTPVSKTFMAKDTKHERVDIEVISGKAFVE